MHILSYSFAQKSWHRESVEAHIKSGRILVLDLAKKEGIPDFQPVAILKDDQDSYDAKRRLMKKHPGVYVD